MIPSETEVRTRIRQWSSTARPLLLRSFAWMRRHKVVTILGFLALYLGGEYLLMSPFVNPFPTKKITVRGVFPYDRGWELRFRKEYFTKNPSCKQTARILFIFPQAEVNRHQNVPITVRRDGGNQYSFEYYEDYFLSGFCEWSPGFLFYGIRVNQRAGNDVAMLGFPERLKGIDYACRAKARMDYISKNLVIWADCFEEKKYGLDPSRPHNEANFTWRGESK